MPLAPGDPWAGYARTVVEIVRPGQGHLVVRSAPPGEVGDWPWASPEPVHVLTAWDPGDERPGDEENRTRQAELEAELRPLASAMWVAVGIDPVSGHREEGVAVCGVSEDDGAGVGRALRTGRHLRVDAGRVGHRGLRRRAPGGLGMVRSRRSEPGDERDEPLLRRRGRRARRSRYSLQRPPNAPMR